MEKGAGGGLIQAPDFLDGDTADGERTLQEKKIRVLYSQRRGCQLENSGKIARVAHGHHG